jgi:hypothetical protein
MRTFHIGGIAGAQGDITQGLPRVEELFEARVPKDKSEISEIDGVVEITKDESTNQRTVHVISTNVFFDGERLYVSDSQNNRVMGWNGMPTQNNQPADFFVGQAGGSTGSPNAAAGSQTPNAIGFHIPGEITVAQGSLFVVDQVNFRVVVHTPRPTTSGTSAGAVLGKSDFADGEVAAEQSLTPRGVAVQGDKLWVSDSNLAIGGSRVLRYQLTNLP